MKEKKNFDKAYKILCDVMYKLNEIDFEKEIKTGKRPELVRADILQLKIRIDKILKGHTRLIYKHLKPKNHN